MKEAKTIKEQIEILEHRGLTIEDKTKAEENLMDIGFYRLGFYSFPFEKSYPSLKNRNHTLVNGALFSDIVSLYYFDTDLRNILIYYLNRIEISLRTYITYTISNHYKKDPVWFVNPNCVNKSYIDSFEGKVYKTIKGNPTINQHHKKYINDRFAPAWKTLEFMTLGNILSLYNNIKDSKIQKEIANHFGCNVGIFKNYFETIRVLRNSCAHGACIYNIHLSRGIKSGPAGRFQSNDRHNICGAIDVVKYVVGKISENRQIDMNNKINDLINAERSAILCDIIKKSAGFSIEYLENAE